VASGTSICFEAQLGLEGERPLTDRPIHATVFVNKGGNIIWTFEISYHKQDI
jgi:hypothetical protein